MTARDKAECFGKAHETSLNSEVEESKVEDGVKSLESLFFLNECDQVLAVFLS